MADLNDFETVLPFFLLLICCVFSGAEPVGMESLTPSLRCVCPSRRPGCDTQGVRDEADGPVSEARGDVSRQAPFTHIPACQHTRAGPIGSASMVCVCSSQRHTCSKESRKLRVVTGTVLVESRSTSPGTGFFVELNVFHKINTH